MKRLLWIGGLGLFALCGCGKFFVSQNGTTTPPVTNPDAGNVLYIANASTTAPSISAYLVSSTGVLTPVHGSPYALPVSGIPLSMAITPGNTFLYVGTTAGVIGYSIGTNGVLTELSSGSALVAGVLPTAMGVDAGGTTLLTAALTTGTASIAVNGYGIDSSTGALTVGTGFPLAVDSANTSTTAIPTQLYFTPDDSLIYVTLATGGTEYLTYTAPGGVADGGNLALSTNGTSQNNVVADSTSSLLFVTETGAGVRVFTIESGGGLAEISGSPFAAGTGATGLALNSAGTYLYAANKGSNTITGFTVASGGALKATTTATTGSLPLWLSFDQSGKYLAVANSGGTPDLGVYSPNATTGALTADTTKTFGSSAALSIMVIATVPTS
jgi:6-phosphogluconolactonase